MLIALVVLTIYVIGLLATMKGYKQISPNTPLDIVLTTSFFWFFILPADLVIYILKLIYKKI